jgi:hypothetical protein
MPLQAQVEAEVQLQPIHKLGARREWMVSTTAQPFSQKRHIPIVQEAGWALELLQMGMENPPPRLSTLKQVIILTTLLWLPLFTYHITCMGTV